MAGIQIDGVNNKIDFDDDLDTSISANTDDTLVFEIAGATDFTMTANTFTAASGSDVVLTGTTTGAQHRAFWDSSNNSLDFGDSTQLRMGASADLKIYHDGSNSYIVDSGTGNLKISAADLQIMNSASSELMIQGVENGAVTLYHNNIAKASTGATGLLINGTGATYGQLGVENAGDAQVDLFSNVGSGTVGKAEIFFSSDTGSDHLSMASIVMIQDGAGDRKGEIRFNVSDNGGPATAVTIANNKNVTFAAGLLIGGTGAANTLDDYEEGVTGNITINSNSGTVSLAGGFKQLAYTKVGRVVHMTGLLKPTTSDASGGINFALPFALADTSDRAEICRGFGYVVNAANANSAGGGLVLEVQTGGSTTCAIIKTTNTANGLTDMNTTYIAAGGTEISVDFSYITA